MKIELKKFHFSESLSEETNAFTADVYIDGVKAGYAKNDGRGGCTFYHAYEGKLELIKKAEQYCKSLPPIVYPMTEYRTEPLTIEMDLEHMIDNLVDEQLKLKDQKKLERKFANHVIWGVPNADAYTQVKFPHPLSMYPKDKLQAAIDKYKKDFKPGEVFLNNNFEALGIKA